MPLSMVLRCQVSAHEAKSIRQQPGSEHVAKIEQQQGLSFNRSFDFVDQHITDCATSRGGKGGCPQKLLQQLLSKPPNSAVGPAQHAPSLMHPRSVNQTSQLSAPVQTSSVNVLGLCTDHCTSCQPTEAKTLFMLAVVHCIGDVSALN